MMTMAPIFLLRPMVHFHYGLLHMCNISATHNSSTEIVPHIVSVTSQWHTFH